MGYAMTHFSLGEWIDMARGLVAEDQGNRMQAHLTSGCARCSHNFEFLGKLTVTCRSLASGRAPEHLTRSAKSLFPASREAGPVKRLLARLVFDSWLETAPAGTRSSWQTGWQGLYRAGDCSLDLRIEPELHSSRAAVIGQISNHLLPAHKMSGLPVRLKSGGLVVAETRSNQFGEFQLEYEQQSRLQLCVYLHEGSRCFQVPLKKFKAEKPAVRQLNPGPTKARKQGGTDELQ